MTPKEKIKMATFNLIARIDADENITTVELLDADLETIKTASVTIPATDDFDIITTAAAEALNMNFTNAGLGAEYLESNPGYMWAVETN